MRLAILVTGPNASGKTTATRAALAPWAQDDWLLTVYADNSDRKAFKGTQTDIEDRLLALWEQDAQLLIVEGTNRIATAFGRVIRRSESRQWEANFTQVAPEFLLWALRTRCEKLGKRFRDDYWDEKKATYETKRRFEVINGKWLDGRARWWPVGDAYAGIEHLGAHIATRAAEVLGAPQVVEEPLARKGMLF